MEAEYERYHENVWPEVLAACARMGIRNYSIFRYENWLFSYFELPDGSTIEEIAGRTVECEACRRWELAMHELQEPLPESCNDNWWVTMREFFHYE